jgi:hypothetical protein
VFVNYFEQFVILIGFIYVTSVFIFVYNACHRNTNSVCAEEMCLFGWFVFRGQIETTQSTLCFATEGAA